MQLCDDDHEEVCFDGKNCPVCEEQTTVTALEEKIEELKEKIEELNNANNYREYYPG